MKFEDFNNIDLKTAGSAPLAVRSVLLSVLFVILIAIGYYLFWAPALESLESAKNKEMALRQTFLAKKQQAINLDVYKQQMVETENAFGALLKQLPDRSQIDGLLTDINQAGLERGLEFELFKPEAQIMTEFYAEMPISIRVLGRYEDLGAFATNVSKLSRIVTLDNIEIKHAENTNNQFIGDDLLVMNATARTYRYLDAAETAAQKALKNKKETK